LNLGDTLKDSGVFNFPLCNTYHGNSEIVVDPDTDVTSNTHTRFTYNYYHRIDVSQLKNINFFKTNGARFYKYNQNGDLTLVQQGDSINQEYTYYIKHIDASYKNVKRDSSFKNKTLYIMSKAV
jgi:hypothetical protein